MDDACSRVTNVYTGISAVRIERQDSRQYYRSVPTHSKVLRSDNRHCCNSERAVGMAVGIGAHWSSLYTSVADDKSVRNYRYEQVWKCFEDNNDNEIRDCGMTVIDSYRTF
jgi:hypothetical protein